MDALVLLEPGSTDLQRRPVPVPEPDEVLVRVESVGICGSDVHYFNTGRIGEFVVESPLVLGHEVAGQVVRVGSSVDETRVGDRVALEPQRPCLECRRCLSGRYNLCAQMKFMATPPVDGALCEFVAVPGIFAHAVPDSMSYDAAALLEPVSVCIATCRRAGLKVGQSVHIAGAGPIGLLMTQVARAFGASTVTVSEPDPIRRSAAASYGASLVLDPGEVRLRTWDFDVFIDASGVSEAIVNGIRSVGPGGTAVIVGLGEENVTLPLTYITSREIKLTGIFRYTDTWPSAIDLVVRGLVAVEPLVTRHLLLSEAAQGLAGSPPDGELKTVVHPVADFAQGGRP